MARYNFDTMIKCIGKYKGEIKDDKQRTYEIYIVHYDIYKRKILMAIYLLLRSTF